MKKKPKVSSATKGGVMNLVQEFLKLNELRRDRPLTSQEVENWFSLKRKIEEQLFANPPAKSDRRQSLRLRNLKFPVTFDGGMGTVEGVMREASEGGLFVMTSDPLPVGMEMKVKVPLRDKEGFPQEDIELNTRVIYNNVGHSFSDRAFSGMGLIIGPELPFLEKQKWFQFLDRLLEEFVQKGVIEWTS